jgi:hypothetical protein
MHRNGGRWGTEFTSRVGRDRPAARGNLENVVVTVTGTGFLDGTITTGGFS